MCTVLTATDRLDGTERCLREGQGKAEALGLRWSLPHWHAQRACALLERGALDDAVVEAEACLAVAEDLEVMRAVPLARSVLTDVAVRQGDLPRARAHLQAARSMVPFEHPPHLRDSLAALAQAICVQLRSPSARNSSKTVCRYMPTSDH
ncbi:hypothetical protein ABT187_29960 [Streptomyces sp. NPDC001817]|uniref:hypothetical protein n=1 Tax=Streptomyces sp. NPDC001817 TaxID=3154398 RepID=UPI00331C416A